MISSDFVFDLQTKFAISFYLHSKPSKQTTKLKPTPSNPITTNQKISEVVKFCWKELWKNCRCETISSLYEDILRCEFLHFFFWVKRIKNHVVTRNLNNFLSSYFHKLCWKSGLLRDFDNSVDVAKTKMGQIFLHLVVKFYQIDKIWHCTQIRRRMKFEINFNHSES